MSEIKMNSALVTTAQMNLMSMAEWTRQLQGPFCTAPDYSELKNMFRFSPALA
ncbi:hypothetical protein MHYP_G00157390 [Metynnis hypsauchen]